MLGPSTAPSYALDLHVLPFGNIENNLRAALPSAAPGSVASDPWHLTPWGFWKRELTSIASSPLLPQKPTIRKLVRTVSSHSADYLGSNDLRGPLGLFYLGFLVPILEPSHETAVSDDLSPPLSSQ